MGWACGMYGREQRCLHGFGAANLRERDNLQDVGTGGNILLRGTEKEWFGRAWTWLIWLSIVTSSGLL